MRRETVPNIISKNQMTCLLSRAGLTPIYDSKTWWSGNRSR